MKSPQDIMQPPFFPLPEGKRYLFQHCIALWNKEYKQRLDGCQLDDSEIFVMKHQMALEIMDIVLEENTGEPLAIQSKKTTKILEKVSTPPAAINRMGQKVIAIDVSTGEEFEYGSVTEASKATGVGTNVIHGICKGDRKSLKGWSFKKIK